LQSQAVELCPVLTDFCAEFNTVSASVTALLGSVHVVLNYVRGKLTSHCRSNGISANGFKWSLFACIHGNLTDFAREFPERTVADMLSSHTMTVRDELLTDLCGLTAVTD
jgi:hypothetical protein